MSIGGSARGPFLLCITRPGAKKGFWTSEWLKGEVSKDDVEEEAQALLTDPRDSVVVVNVWSLKDGQFVGGWKR
jgi:hypothetical protein